MDVRVSEETLEITTKVCTSLQISKEFFSSWVYWNIGFQLIQLLEYDDKTKSET